MSVSNDKASSGRKVSVIIPTYNRAELVRHAIDSILLQTAPPLEIIVVNDGSTDGTSEVLQTYEGRIIYLEQSNGGKSAALNNALQHVTGEYVWIFDDDDIALPDAIARHLDVLEQNPDVDFSYSPFYHCFSGSDGSLVPTRSTALPELSHEPLVAALLDRCCITQPGSIVRKTCYDKLGGFDERLVRSQDYQMLLRLAVDCRGFPVSQPTFLCRTHSGDRGSAADRFGHQDKAKKWAEYDQLFTSEYYYSLPLAAYINRAEDGGALSNQETTTALLRRSAIFARKGFPELMLRDLQKVATMSDDDLNQQQAQLCQKAMTAVYPIAYRQFTSYPHLARLIREACRSAMGVAIRVELARGAYHQLWRELHDHSYRQAASLVWLVPGIIGLQGLWRLIFGRQTES